MSIRTLFATIAVATLPITGMAQATIERFFVEMPDSLLLVLPRKARVELMQLAQRGAEPVVDNLFGLPTRIAHKTDDFLSILLTPSSRLEIRKLQTDTSEVFASIYTLLTPAPDSHIVFYTADYCTDIPQFAMPDLGDFIQAPDSVVYIERKRLSSILFPLHIGAKWAAESEMLTLEVGTQNLSKEEQQDANALLRPVVLVWQRGSWRKKRL
ncbi:MAG: DUF3256 family protein [Bacteroidaceae bacterium]|nr:DUF3256 family protein [Bacteroidaceae bacterium]